MDKDFTIRQLSVEYALKFGTNKYNPKTDRLEPISLAKFFSNVKKFSDYLNGNVAAVEEAPVE